jgi:cobalt-precorrin 5A hydrolase/precorrin-3B C17-methyltransferase
LARQAVALVASLDLKEDEAAVESLAERLAVPARFFSAAELNAEADRLANPSELVFAEVGCPGVAEGAALAATGPEGAVIVEKTKSKRATCAIALSPEPIDPDGVGRPRGQLLVVGIGPGTEDWRSPEASAALRHANDWVGYGLYLDLAAGASPGAARHAFALGEEEARVRHARGCAMPWRWRRRGGG